MPRGTSEDYQLIDQQSQVVVVGEYTDLNREFRQTFDSFISQAIADYLGCFEG